MGSKLHYHFVRKRSPSQSNLRVRRDTSLNRRVLAREDSIQRVEQQFGYKRVKRGYKSVEDLKKKFPDYKPPTDPYFKHQWYLVSLIIWKKNNNELNNLKIKK